MIHEKKVHLQELNEASEGQSLEQASPMPIKGQSSTPSNEASREHDDPEWLFRPAYALPHRFQESKSGHGLSKYGFVSTSSVPVVSIQKTQPLQPEEQKPQSPSTGEGAKEAPAPVAHRRSLWSRVSRKRVPELRQVTATECGAASLAMVLSYYGRPTTISEIRERVGIGRDGMSALAVVKAARQYGLRVRAVSLQESDLRAVPLPAIVHWEFNHYVVVEGWSPQRVDIVDPAQGRRRLTAQEFDESFTGVVLILEPGAHFDKTAVAPQVSFSRYLRSLLRSHGLLTQILSASLLLQMFGLVSPFLTQTIVDQVLPGRSVDLLRVLGLGMLFLLLGQGVTMLLRSSLLIVLQTRLDAQMRQNFFEHLLSLPYRFFQLRFSGDLLARISSHNAVRDLLTDQLISTMLDGSTVLVYLMILLSRSLLTSMVALGIGLVQISVLFVTGPIVRRQTRQLLIAQGKTQSYLNEALSSIATLKAAGAEPRALNKWTNYFFDEQHISVKAASIAAVTTMIMGMLRLGAPLLLLWVGAWQVIQGSISLGTMLSLNALASAFLVPLSSLATTGQQVQQVRAHFERIADVLGAESEQDLGQVQEPPQLSGRIEMEDVRFQYDPQAPLIVRDISLTIKPGQKVALVGKTGSGKSTLGKMLIGLITPTQGAIRYDGIPLNTLNYHEVRRQFGVVMQEAAIFSGSIRENIAFNKPDMGLEQVVISAKKAGLHEDILKMPMGYETMVSEAGSALSGGQRQRLALARALAPEPVILLLDEATSSLDVVTEQYVDRQLNQLSCTRIVIAHRLSTIQNADVILVLDQGKIVERGTHNELLRQGGFYARLIRAQMQANVVM